MECVNVFPQIQKERANELGAPLIICITLDRRIVARKPLKKRVKLQNWDSKARVVLKGESNHALINALIRSEVAKLDKEIMERQLLGIPITAFTIKAILKGASRGGNFIAYCKKRITERWTHPTTIRTYENEISKLEEYRPGAMFGDITVEYLEGYRRFLVGKNNKPNTVWKSLKYLNTMVLDGIKMGNMRAADNPFDKFDRGKYVNPEKLGLEDHELESIERTSTRDDVPVEVTEVALRFLAMCYTGLRISDGLTFDPRNHIVGGRFVIRTTKFGVCVDVKVNKRLQRILDRWPDSPIKMSEATFRKWLRVVGSLSRVSSLNPHKARHTMGTMLATAGVTEIQAQRILGHRAVSSTRVYYHLQKKGIDNGIDKLDQLE